MRPVDDAPAASLRLSPPARVPTVQIDNDALSEMKKKQNYESLRITELQGLIKNMLDHIEVKVRIMTQ